MAILKPVTRPASSIRVERTPEDKKGPLKPSGGGIKKTSAKASSSSALSSSRPITGPLSGPISSPHTGPSSTGSSPNLSKTTKTSQTATKAVQQPKKPKTVNVLRNVRRSKKLVKAGSIPGLMPISSFGSIASAMRATLAETQLREKQSSGCSQVTQ
ncbi:uncharacterized protein LY79DRAFT_653440 [Colletotrichum navitas]|uniref:Uncharacterized protein n=1 Tax=Colletotrichum navitas TaxID=681940 RepID=A0AAD8PMI3_9PEZI|nr:uncharacterized protein LY79DRAFT_653440 [Colletotrichum navitas]KAK1572703.1 hypothetical protein LY79DRAFT_653440 [Colletotrichum navitas]